LTGRLRKEEDYLLIISSRRIIYRITDIRVSGVIMTAISSISSVLDSKLGSSVNKPDDHDPFGLTAAFQGSNNIAKTESAL